MPWYQYFTISFSNSTSTIVGVASAKEHNVTILVLSKVDTIICNLCAEDNMPINDIYSELCYKQDTILILICIKTSGYYYVFI